MMRYKKMNETVTLSTKTVFVLNGLYLPLVPLMAWLSMPVESILCLTVLSGIDFTTGVIKVYRINGTLKSYRAISGFLAKGAILLLIFALAFMAKGLNLDFSSYLSMFISALIIAETYSIFGNVYASSKRVEIEEFDAVSAVVKSMRKIIEKMLIINREQMK